jgi:hypothetical protein
MNPSSPTTATTEDVTVGDKSQGEAAAAATKAFLSLLVGDQVPVMDFLGDPMDALKLMYVCKATRKVAGRKLVELQQDPATKWKQQCFDAWLSNPSVGNSDEPEGTYRMMTDTGHNHGLCGPLRLDEISAFDYTFRTRFIVLNYHRTYHKEKCLLAVFDEDGWLFSLYCFESHMDGTACDSDMPPPMSYHGYMRRGVYWKCSFFALATSDDWAYRYMGGPYFLRYSITVEDGLVEGPSFAVQDFELIDLFDGFDNLSPTEVVCVLWHALSADPCVIREYLWAFYDDGFDQDLRGWPNFLLPHGNDPANERAYSKLKRVREVISLLEKATYFADEEADGDESHMDESGCSSCGYNGRSDESNTEGLEE